MRRLARLLSVGYLLVCVVALVAMVFVGPLGYAPYPLPLGPTREPITILIAYSTEKQEWLQEAVRRFNAAGETFEGRPIIITLEAAGSQEIVGEIAQGRRTPTVFSPASSVQIELLRGEWQQRGNGGDIVGAGEDGPQPLVLTPLVIVAWQERAQALWGNGPSSLWRDLHDAISDGRGWARYGRPEWGPVKFGHTRPTTSNSGVQALLLMAYAFHNKASGLTVADLASPEFQQWLVEMERGVSEFGDSTGTFMTNMVLSGPGKYDMVAVYENLAIQDIEKAQSRWGQPVRVYYPPATILSDHPYAILDAPWVTAEQRGAARAFRDYLLSDEIQQLALQYGFRPANPNVAVATGDAQNPFNRYRDYGLDIGGIGQQVETPPAEVIAQLIQIWRQRVNR